MERTSQLSPRLLGRMVAVCYLVLMLSGFDLFVVIGRLVLQGDAAAAAARIGSHPDWYLAGSVAAFLGVAAALVVTVLFYCLFEPVSRTLSIIAACFSLTGCVVQAVALIFHYLPLILLGGEPFLGVFPPAQLQAFAFALLRFYVQAYNVSLAFFGSYLLLLGYLTYRSGFLPRWLGVLVAFGAGWMVYLYPPLARALSPYVALSSVGEIFLVGWLGLKGVDEQRWREPV